MSMLKMPKGLDKLDQTKSYHIAADEESLRMGVLCGILEHTGETSHYEYFYCASLRCTKCGATLDVGDYDKLYVGSESDLGDTW